MPIDLVVVDAFTQQPFAGNPAAVCVLDSVEDAARVGDPSWMQRVAREMNLSETAFLVPREDIASFDLRWFTPTVEMDLCGHATLASAYALFLDDVVDPASAIRFHTRSGVLEARRTSGGAIDLDFPAERVDATPPSPALLSALALSSDAVSFAGLNRVNWMVAVEHAATVRALAPDLVALRALDTGGVIVTAPADAETPPEHDFVSRYFAPNLGVDEDPVTGSAHCALGPYWFERLGQTEATGYQASDRGGTVHVSDRGERVGLRGHAVITLRSRLIV